MASEKFKADLDGRLVKLRRLYADARRTRDAVERDTKEWAHYDARMRRYQSEAEELKRVLDLQGSIEAERAALPISTKINWREALGIYDQMVAAGQMCWWPRRDHRYSIEEG